MSDGSPRPLGVLNNRWVNVRTPSRKRFDSISNPRAENIMGKNAVGHLNGDRGVLSEPNSIELSFGAYGTLNTGLSSALNLNPEVDPAGMIDDLRPAGALADVSVRGTFRVDPRNVSDEEAITVTIGASVNAGASVGVSGNQKVASIYRDVDSMRDQWSALSVRNANSTQQISGLITQIQSLALEIQNGGAAPNAAQIKRIRSLATQAESQFRAAGKLMSDTNSAMGDFNQVLSRIGQKALDTKASVIANGHGEVHFGTRVPLPRVNDNLRFTIGLQGHFVIPAQVPKSLKGDLNELEPYLASHAGMVAVSMYSNLSAEGIPQIQAMVGDLQDGLGTLKNLADDAADTTHAAQTSPITAIDDALDLVDSIEKTNEEIEKSQDSLAAHFDELTENLDIDAEIGIQTEQVTGNFGGGLDRGVVEMQWDSDNRNQRVRVQAYVDNAFGYLKGNQRRYGLGVNGETEMVSSQTVNSYQTFFPRTFGLNADASFNRNTRFRTGIIAGFATNGQVGSAHLGFSQHFWNRIVLRAGIIDPNIGARGVHTLMGTTGFDILMGRRGSEASAYIGVHAGAAAAFGPRLPGTKPLQLGGANGGLRLGGRF